MDETSKSRRLWGDLENSILAGRGIDIGCGRDPVTEDAARFDVEHGDANHITRHITERFDFVYASHCLEHMHRPREAILEWWSLVRPGGHLFFMVPDEDLYEQGVFPSRFNPDHKATFTIFKQSSWSPVSVNVSELAASLPNGHLVKLVLQDQGYDRTLLKHGRRAYPVLERAARLMLKAFRGSTSEGAFFIPALWKTVGRFVAVDQTLRPDVVAQIQCIVRKLL